MREVTTAEIHAVADAISRLISPTGLATAIRKSVRSATKEYIEEEFSRRGIRVTVTPTGVNVDVADIERIEGIRDGNGSSDQ